MFEIGTVLRLQVADTNPPKVKYCIIVGQCSDKIATIFINSEVNVRHLPQNLQGVHFPLSKDDYSFLDHGSYANCGQIVERDKRELNTIIQKEPGRKAGVLSKKHKEDIVNTVKRAKTISKIDKDRFNIGLEAAPIRQAGADVETTSKSPES